MSQQQLAKAEQTEFPYRLDHHWKAIAFYTLALLSYSLIAGSIDSGSIELNLLDPGVILLFLIVVYSGLSFLINWYSRRSIIIKGEQITFRNRFRDRTFSAKDIAKILIGRERMVKVRGVYKVIRIKLHQRRRMLRVRPSLYENETELTRVLANYKRTYLAK